jgi:hypothetical protein
MPPIPLRVNHKSMLYLVPGAAVPPRPGAVPLPAAWAVPLSASGRDLLFLEWMEPGRGLHAADPVRERTRSWCTTTCS